MATTRTGLHQAEGIELTGYNIHGSVATTSADQFEPNFRLFEWASSPEPPSQSLVDRLHVNKPGESPWGRNEPHSGEVRNIPVLLTSIPAAFIANHMYCKQLLKSSSIMRLSIFGFYGVTLAWNNFSKWLAREHDFRKDFQRNQAFVQEERKYLKDEQRVREEYYKRKFSTDPVADYRVRQWEVANMFA